MRSFCRDMLPLRPPPQWFLPFAAPPAYPSGPTMPQLRSCVHCRQSGTICRWAGLAQDELHAAAQDVTRAGIAAPRLVDMAHMFDWVPQVRVVSWDGAA
jgi:hypothetical protein